MNKEFVMTEEETREYIKEVNTRFLKETPMSPTERQAVRRWMKKGHCILEPWDSPYLPGPMDPPYNFLDCYRLNREMERETAGMNEDETVRYLKNYWGWQDDPAESEEPKKTMADAQAQIRKLNRKFMILWEYLLEKGLWQDAEEYMEEHKEDTFPFEDEWY